MDARMPVAGTVVILRDGPDGLEVLLIRRPASGSFAGAWVFPGGVVEAGDVRPSEDEVDGARRAAIRETFEEVGLVPSGLMTLSQWIPPAEAPKRVRTWFFVAADTGGDIVAAPTEVAAWRWLRPADALAQHATGELKLVPPTWVTLHALLGVLDTRSALAAAAAPGRFETHVLREPDGLSYLWDGDAEHPNGGGGRHRLRTATLPWRYERR
jgi:8-oxo-dGTP pyrophosphatase MutT (NUDIX family)